MVQGGVQYDLAFLRPLTWIEATGAKVGGSIHMELHEMGLNGPAEVVAIDACPQIKTDDGTGRNVVTGTMAHPGDNILYLDITGLDEPLGVTDTHPIWSETRQDFVVAGQLELGEQFRTLTGESATLTKIHPHRGPPEMVFNLEVDGEHVYSAGGEGLLVHNSCLWDVAGNAASPHNGKLLGCSDCANDILQAVGDAGTRVRVRARTGDIIMMDGVQEAISKNSFHEGVLVDGKIFDNFNDNGILPLDWFRKMDTIADDFAGLPRGVEIILPL